MKAHRDVITLSDVCELIVDCEHKTAPTQEHGFPLIRTPNIGRGRLILDGVQRVSEAAFEAWTRRAVPRGGDLIFAREAPVGNVAIVPANTKVCLGQRTVLIRPNTERVDGRYLVYLLLGDEIQGLFQSLANGATVHHLNLGDIRQLVLPRIPSRTDQVKIASILSAYDDLIENNLRRIAILEEMARAICREWFVKFRYPGYERTQMTESELGLIPEEWQVAELRTVATLIRNSTNPAKNPNARYAHYSIPAFDANRMPAMELGGDIRSTKYIVGDDCVLVSKLNPRIPRVWLPFVHNEYLSISSTEFLVLSPIAPVTRTFLYNLCLDDWFLNGLVTSAYGTSTSHQRVKPEHVMSTAIVLPPAGLIQRFTDMVQPMHELIYTLRKAVLSLREARDLLLPQLISGELDVSNITIDAEEDNL